MALWHENLTPYNNARNNVIDSRFAQSRYPHANNIQRGRIENIDLSTGVAVAEKKHVFHFLTNPSQIDLGYEVNSSVDLTDPANYATVMSGIPPMRDGLLSVSFEMLLDRTYEVWTGNLPEGVLHDIAQLEKVLGMPDQIARGSLPGSVVNEVRKATGGGPHAIFPGVIIKRPIRIIFGGQKAFSFDGYISSLSITLMKFNKNMCATRAGIRISATSWGDVDSGGGGGGDVFAAPSTSSPAPGSLPLSPINVLGDALAAQRSRTGYFK